MLLKMDRTSNLRVMITAEVRLEGLLLLLKLLLLNSNLLISGPEVDLLRLQEQVLVGLGELASLSICQYLAAVGAADKVIPHVAHLLLRGYLVVHWRLLLTL